MLFVIIMFLEDVYNALVENFGLVSEWHQFVDECCFFLAIPQIQVLFLDKFCVAKRKKSSLI